MGCEKVLVMVIDVNGDECTLGIHVYGEKKNSLVIFPSREDLADSFVC